MDAQRARGDMVKIPKEPNSNSDLTEKLMRCDFEIREYVEALKSENFKLQKQIAKYQAHQVTLENRIRMLEDDQHKPVLQVHFNIEPPNEKSQTNLPNESAEPV